MKASDDTILQYLFGELPEAERTTLEAEYFADPQAFDRLEHFENDLIDDYARERLAPETRARFERAYLSDPNRRARLKFAEALAVRAGSSVGQPAAQTGLSPAIRSGNRWQRLFSIPLRRPGLAFSMAALLLLLAAGSVWLFIESRRLGAELAQTEAEQARQEQYQTELQQQLADEQKRNQELQAELERASNLPAPPAKPAPEGASPAFATLMLAATGIRGAETTPPRTLTIPKGTAEVRLQLALKDISDYQSYQIVVRAIAGAEIVNRKGLKTTAGKSGAAINLSLPAAKFSSGDYMMTLKGVLPGGEIEDVSKSLFRVEKK